MFPFPFFSVKEYDISIYVGKLFSQLLHWNAAICAAHPLPLLTEPTPVSGEGEGGGGGKGGGGEGGGREFFRLKIFKMLSQSVLRLLRDSSKSDRPQFGK